VNSVDATLVKLAEPATRSAQFDEASLEQLIDAAYGLDDTGAQKPYTPVFDEFRLGVATPRVGALDGVWKPAGSAEPVEARFHMDGIGDGSDRVDAYWRGSIVARFRVGGEPVVAADGEQVDLSGIDDDIVADLGALPADPPALEAARRERLRERLQAAAGDPGVVTDAMVERWLAAVGASSAGDLLAAARGTQGPFGVAVRFAEPGDVAAAPAPLPIAAVLLIRDGISSLADLLAESKRIAERLRPLGLEPATEGSPRPRHRMLVVWVVPDSTFDDTDWPGGTSAVSAEQRAKRRASAGRWLAAEGIGLVATPTP
jgi:hypothetical protein